MNPFALFDRANTGSKRALVLQDAASSLRTCRQRLLPRWVRAVGLVMLPIVYITSLPAYALAQAEQAVREAKVAVIENLKPAPPEIKINHTLPPGVIDESNPSGSSQNATSSLVPRFSAAPQDSEFLNVPLLQEPLVPTSAKPQPGENAALAKALMDYAASFGQQPNLDAAQRLTPLVHFLADRPGPRWSLALWLDLGLVYRRTGYWTRALDAWEQAWTVGKNVNDPRARPLADRAVAELAELNARLGRYERLEPLFAELDAAHRTLHGSAADRLAGSKQGLWMMNNQPDRAFRCGPMALNSLMRAQDPHSPQDPKIFGADSTRRGISLDQVAALSRDINRPMQMAFRQSDKAGHGADFLTPAVVHWKAGHYAALVDQKDSRYRVDDPTFGNTMWVSRAALEAETDGYFLVAANQTLPAGWRTVADAEGSQVWGKGNTDNRNPDNTSCDDTSCEDCPQCLAGPDSGDDGSGGSGGYGGMDGTEMASASFGGGGKTAVGMASYNIEAMLTSLSVVDVPLSYSPPRGGSVSFMVRYSQHEANQPAVFNYWNLGQKWTSSWLSYLTDNNIAMPDSAGNLHYLYIAPPSVYLPGGGREVFDQPPTTLNSDAVAQGANPLYEYKNPHGGRSTTIDQTDMAAFKRRLRDGTVETYSHLVGSLEVAPHQLLITERKDPRGNTTKFHYDSQHRLVAVEDALGQMTTLSYGNSDPLKVTQVTDPFGRSCLLAYNGQGQLQSVTDTAGIQSTFAYQAGGDFINALTTPYGTSTFAFGDASTDPSLGTTAWLEATDPYGDKARAEYNQNGAVTGLPASETAPAGIPVFNAALYARNTFYWDKKAYQGARRPDGSFDHTQARLFHFLHDIDTNVTSGVLESTKSPLESRVWRFYQGQNSAGFLNDGMSQQPSMVARLMDDGSTQLYQYQYNDQQKLIQATDPLGRVVAYDYDPANGIDLLRARNVSGGLNEWLASATYNAAHQPLTTTDAAGQTMTWTYNAFGQVQTIQDPTGRTVTYQHDGQGYLQEIDGFDPSIKRTFTYDGFGRLAGTTTYPDAYTVQVGYDAVGGNPLATLNRPTTATFPDGSYTEVDYTNLDAEWLRDRGGNWTRVLTNKLRQTEAVINPLGAVTQYGYCKCGQLVKIIDPNGNVTQWKLDAAARRSAKIYADNTEVDYAYEATTSRLKTVTDAKGQHTHYAYNLDGTLQSVTYTEAEHATPGVSYTYDPARGRLATIVDGIGTTTYSYYPYGSGQSGTAGAGQIQSVSGPFPNETVAYQYDALGRVTTRTVDGVDESYGFDSLGRLQTDTNALGTFTYGYDGTTGRLASVAYPNGVQALYSYLEDNTQDRRLSQLKHFLPGGNTLDQFDYSYDGPLGRISHWDQQQPGATVGTLATSAYDLSYNAAGQLRRAVLNGDPTNAGSSVWSYDAAGNRTTTQTGSSTVSTAVPTATNALFSIKGGGKVRVAGNLDKWAQVTVNGQAASLDAATDTFEAFVLLATGNQTLAIQATDASGNTATNRYQLTVTAGASKSITYDLNGNISALTSEGITASPQTMEWDASDRVLAINTGTHRTEFGYNGSGVRVRITEKDNNNVISDRLYVAGEERDAISGQAIRKFYALGEQRIGGSDAGKYFYTNDHLGSLRAVIDAGGTMRVSYGYGLWGQRTTLQGNLETETGFTGYWHHQQSEMEMSPTRAYHADLGRFVNRDPIQEKGGINLYGYVLNDPVNLSDPFGLYDYSANETYQNFLLPAQQGVSSGQWNGLLYIRKSSQNEDDFGHTHPNDTFCVNGRRMSGFEFGNYIAGYKGALYDRMYGTMFALNLVNLAGIGYHMAGASLQVTGRDPTPMTTSPEDPWDVVGRSDIAAGAQTWIQKPADPAKYPPPIPAPAPAPAPH